MAVSEIRQATVKRKTSETDIALLPYLLIDILSPIASLIASPSTIPTSSIVWWQSTIRWMKHLSCVP